MKDIDYEAIARQVWMTGAGQLQLEIAQKVIEAYEAQKRPPEWVPLDLATVKQGQEVRHRDWAEKDRFEIFIAYYDDHLILEDPKNLDVPGKYYHNSLWLMRAPKPKTVKVRVYRTAISQELYAYTDGQAKEDAPHRHLVGEGEVEVRE